LKKIKDSPPTKQKPDSLLCLVDPYNIEEAAYYQWINRGGQGGDAVNDWLTAELELRKKLYHEE
jgi:hypothetical protein